MTPLRRLKHQLAPLLHRCEGVTEEGRKTSGGREPNNQPNTSTFNHDITDDFSTRPKRFLRLAIQLSPNAAGIPKRHNELILGFPLTLFTGT